jgi:hypothetical protein
MTYIFFSLNMLAMLVVFAIDVHHKRQAFPPR